MDIKRNNFKRHTDLLKVYFITHMCFYYIPSIISELVTPYNLNVFNWWNNVVLYVRSYQF